MTKKERKKERCCFNENSQHFFLKTEKGSKHLFLLLPVIENKKEELTIFSFFFNEQNVNYVMIKFDDDDDIEKS